MQPDDPRSVLASRLRGRRNLLGLDQKDVALAADVSQPTVSDWELGISAPPSDKLRAIAEKLGCSCDFLVGITDHESGLRPGFVLGDRGLVDAVMKAKTLAEVRALQEQHGGLNFFADVPPQPQLLTRTAAKKLEAEIDKKLGELGWHP